MSQLMERYAAEKRGEVWKTKHVKKSNNKIIFKTIFLAVVFYFVSSTDVFFALFCCIFLFILINITPNNNKTYNNNSNWNEEDFLNNDDESNSINTFDTYSPYCSDGSINPFYDDDYDNK